MPDENKPTTMDTTSMETRQLHSGQKEAMKKILEFSGEDSDLDIDEWLFDLTNLFSLMKLKDEAKILETMGKLTGPALRWYQKNLKDFTNWEKTEKALKERFKKFISGSELMQEFFKLRQEENQTVTSFYEIVTEKYRRAKKLITEEQVVTVLQNGVKHSLKEHLIRNEKDISTPDDWLEIAKQEEYVQKRIQQQHNSNYTETTEEALIEMNMPIATIQSRPMNARTRDRHINKPPKNDEEPRRHYQSGNNQIHQHRNNHWDMKMNRQNGFKGKAQQQEPCLICNRKNHNTSNCFYKKENGCFKCGQLNHRIRNCPERHFFE